LLTRTRQKSDESVSDFNRRFQRVLRAFKEAAPGAFTPIMALVNYKQALKPKIRPELARAEQSVSAHARRRGTTVLDESYDEAETAEEITRMYDPDREETVDKIDAGTNFTQREETELMQMMRQILDAQRGDSTLRSARKPYQGILDQCNVRHGPTLTLHHTVVTFSARGIIGHRILSVNRIFNRVGVGQMEVVVTVVSVDIGKMSAGKRSIIIFIAKSYVRGSYNACATAARSAKYWGVDSRPAKG
jgi:hypothetical protein